MLEIQLYSKFQELLSLLEKDHNFEHDFVIFFDACEELGFKREFSYSWKEAYQGNLDKAKYIHNVLLGTSPYSICNDNSEDLASVWVKGHKFSTGGTLYFEENYNVQPARAWFISILKAYANNI